MSQFIVKIVVMRDDEIAKILKRMASGTVCAFLDYAAAVQCQKEYHQMAVTVIKGLIARPENYYGFSVIIDDREGTALEHTLTDLGEDHVSSKA